MSTEQLLKEKKGTLVDVRSTNEYQGGHVSGSINIPVQDLNKRMDEICKLKAPILLCCASGARSEMATQILKQQGIQCYNAGSWLDVNYIISKLN